MTKPRFKEVVPYARHSPEPRNRPSPDQYQERRTRATSWPAARGPARLADLWRPWTTRSTTRSALRAGRPAVRAAQPASDELDRTRLDHANLRAAMRAALAAHADGEPDPMWYLRDELDAPESVPEASREAEVTTYRRMRRQARLARRSGLQPMMVINTGEPFPETVGVVLARWAWRYRSELAPASAWPPAWWRRPGGCTAPGRTGGRWSRCWPAWPRGRWPCSARGGDSPRASERVYAAVTSTRPEYGFPPLPRSALRVPLLRRTRGNRRGLSCRFPGGRTAAARESRA